MRTLPFKRDAWSETGKSINPGITLAKSINPKISV
jgi:hypothetical protein